MNVQRSAMTCDEVNELAGAYALDALPADELATVEQHLATCDKPHPDFAELSEIASWLSFTVTPTSLPDELGSRILAGARTVASRPEPTGKSARPENVIAIRPRSVAGFAFALAAAMAALAVGLGAWGLVQRSALEAERQSSRGQGDIVALLASAGVVVQTPASGGLPAALLVQPKGDGPAYLLEDWPQAAAGKSYQAWYIAGGKPVSAGVFDGSPGRLRAIPLAAAARGAQAFAVTLEPSGGSDQPTSQPLFVRELPPA